MTITFTGHVSKLEGNGTVCTVTIQTPMEPVGGKPFVVEVPSKDAQHWLPGRIVSFTIYALPEAVPNTEEGGDAPR